MLNKKAGIPAEEIGGILIFMVVAAIAILLFYSCSANKDVKEHEELKFSKGEIEAAKALNFFLEMPVDEERKVMDLVEELYLNGDYKEFDSITKEHFSNIYNDWRLIIFSEHKTFYESRDESAIRYTNNLWIAEEYLPVFKGAEDLEFMRVILYIYE